MQNNHSQLKALGKWTEVVLVLMLLWKYGSCFQFLSTFPPLLLSRKEQKLKLQSFSNKEKSVQQLWQKFNQFEKKARPNSSF